MMCVYTYNMCEEWWFAQPHRMLHTVDSDAIVVVVFFVVVVVVLVCLDTPR